MLPLLKIPVSKTTPLNLSLAIIIALSSCYLQAQESPTKAVEGSKDELKSSEPKEAKSRILLNNGDSLTGTPHSFDSRGNLEFTSASLNTKAIFPLHNILSLELDNKQDRKVPKTLARLQLHPSHSESQGDMLTGNLTDLTSDSIKLDTWYAGVITLKRKMVKSFQIINNSPGNYHGPNNIKEWTSNITKPSWKLTHGSLKSISTGSIGRDVGLTEKSHLQFTVNWASSMRFRILLYSNDVSSSDPSACYDISFNGNFAYLNTKGKNARKGIFAARGRGQNINIDTFNNTALFDIYANRKSGNITLFINGQHACVLQSGTPDPTDLGKAIHFISQDPYPIEVSALAIEPWNGTSLPNQLTSIAPKSNNTEEDNKKSLTHHIILKNGDKVPGKVAQVKDGRILIETDYTPIRIPLDRIKTLTLEDEEETPRKYAEDVRAWFHDGGRITLKLASFHDGKISGFNQAFGNVSIDLNAFSKIDFDIYNIDQKKRRGQNN